MSWSEQETYGAKRSRIPWTMPKRFRDHPQTPRDDAQDHFGARSTSLAGSDYGSCLLRVAEKEATYAAARTAGIDCLELLAEPVAAVYAMGWRKGDMACLLPRGGTLTLLLEMADRRLRIWLWMARSARWS